MLTTTPAMRKMIEAWEGLMLRAYRDMVGVLTIGYGHTGSDVQAGQVITQAQADQLLSNDLHKFEVAVSGLTNGVPTSQQQFDAMVSFAFNLGSGALAGSTLLRLHRAGNFVGAAAQFQRWDHAGGVEVQGLLRRRLGEAGVYLHGSYLNGG